VASEEHPELGSVTRGATERSSPADGTVTHVPPAAKTAAAELVAATVGNALKFNSRFVCD
jgi:hypothetical protein